MSPHPSDHAVAALVRNARLGAAAPPQQPARTRSVGSHSARQCTVGRLVVEAARADTGVSEEVAAARREIIAAEFERRRLIEAAEQTRRQAELDLGRAERERDDAVRQARQQGGPTPDFLTLALIAAATFEITDSDLEHVIDAAVTDHPDLTDADVSALTGDRHVGLSPEQLSAELAATGASQTVANGLIDTGVATVAPAELIAHSVSASPASEVAENVIPTPETAPEAEQ